MFRGRLDRSAGRTAAPIVALGVGALISLVGCEGVGRSGGVQFKSDPPPLPPSASFVIDLGWFTGPGGTAPATGPSGVAAPAQLHWSEAHSRALALESGLLGALFVPAATLAAAALDEMPGFDASVGRWRWLLTAASGGHTYSGELTGVLAGGQSAFEARLSQPSLGVTSFLWYSGAAVTGNASGFWVLFDPQRPGETVGRLAWTKVSEDSWRLSYAVSDSTEAGATINYERSGAEHTIGFLDRPGGVEFDLSWHDTDGRGFIQADDYNGGIRSCWDSARNDVICPP